MPTQSDGPRPGVEPSPEQFAAALRHHVSYYGQDEMQGEAALVLYNMERSVNLQYVDRVAYELLQNALDRAAHRVHISVAEDDGGPPILLVANDGARVRLDPGFNYRNPPGRERRSDLNALLSLHTSNKTADEAMGNKGIGFRSVFGVGDRVEVWSRCGGESEWWWGVELHWQMTADRWTERLHARPETADAARICWPEGPPRLRGSSPRASFVLPVPLLRQTAPSPLPDDSPFVTVVLVELNEDGEAMRARLRELLASRLHFVGLRERLRPVRVEVDPGSGPEVLRTWPEADPARAWTMHAWSDPSLAGLARDAQHPVSRPGVAVAWPPPPSADALAREYQARTDEMTPPPALDTKVYNYLPTAIPSDLPVDLHGDFQVKADRVSMALDGRSAVSSYNRRLLDEAAALHLREIRALLHPDRAAPPRLDLWRLLRPGPGGDLLVPRLQRELFGEPGQAGKQQCYTEFARLAASFFGHPTIAREGGRCSLPAWVFFDFWETAARWVDRLVGYSRGSKTWRTWAAPALCAALRQVGAPCLPVSDSDEPAPDEPIIGVSLPERRAQDDGGGASARRVFLRSRGERRISLPAALLDRDRAITAFPLGAFADRQARPTGASEFSRWAVLAELRQLPRGPGVDPVIDLHRDPEEAVKRQRGLLRLAAQLFTLPMGNRPAPSEHTARYGLGWRADPSHTRLDVQRAARALATVYLPLKTGGWAPARQVDLSQVDVEALGDLADDVDVPAFLRFLGVSPAPPSGGPPVLLVEGGAAGRVPVRALPPELCSVGSTAVIPPIELVIDKPLRTHPAPLARSILAAWQGGLEAIIAAEVQQEGSETPARTALRASLRDLAWVPVGPGGALPPEGEVEPATSVAPRVLLSREIRDPRRTLFYRLDTAGQHLAPICEALGAAPTLAPHHLRERHGERASWLLSDLRSRYPDPDVLDVRRRHLETLCQTLVEALTHDPVDGSGHPPILVHAPGGQGSVLSGRALEWVDSPDQPGVIAASNGDQELVRRFFPEVPLSAVNLGPKVVGRIAGLGTRAVAIETTVKEDGPPINQGLAQALASRIQNALPGLLALAHASRLAMPDADLVRSRWGSKGPLRQVDDAWLLFTLSGAKSQSRPWFKGTYGDVFLVREDDEGQRAVVLFDVPRGDGSPGDLPLTAFGEAMAELCVDNRSLGALFARGLTEYERGGDAFERLLDREGATALVETYRQRLKPMTQAERAALDERLRQVLLDAGARLVEPGDPLRARHLSPIGDTWGDVTARTLADALERAPWTARERGFVPRLAIEEDNRRAWGTWFAGGRGRRLVAFAHHHGQGRVPDDLQDAGIDTRLNAWLHGHGLPRLDFSPPAAAADWLAHFLGESLPGCTAEDLEETLARFAPRYPEVVELRTAEAARWSAVDGRERQPARKERAPYGSDEAVQDQARRSAIGEEAERALLRRIACDTAKLLQQDGADSTLREATPAGGQTRAALDRALAAWRETGSIEALAEGLLVAKVWGNAGFDIIGLERGSLERGGLERQAGGLRAVRYECKGLPEGTGRVRIFLSNNERRVGSRYHASGGWKLIGVGTDGKATDLTSLVRHLLDHPEAILGPLRSHGLEPDGLVLTVQRG